MAQASGALETRRVFGVSGMDCAEEVAVLKDVLGPLVGGPEHLSFDILNGRMTVTGASLDDVNLAAAVAKTGMRAERWTGERTSAIDDDGRQSRLLLTAASGILTAAGFVAHLALTGDLASAFGSEGAALSAEIPVLARLLYGGAIVSGAWYVVPKGWFALRRFRPDMNLLMTVAVIGAVFIGEWFEAATVIASEKIVGV